MQVPPFANGKYELPWKNLFSITDDDINEVDHSFQLVATIGMDVPDNISCFQTQVGETNCLGRSGATEIILVDNDRKLHILLPKCVPT